MYMRHRMNDIRKNALDRYRSQYWQKLTVNRRISIMRRVISQLSDFFRLRLHQSLTFEANKSSKAECQVGNLRGDFDSNFDEVSQR